ncbi:MAG: glycosyltransferase [Planctomycetota bacterium]|jgi:hypothetical protein
MQVVIQGVETCGIIADLANEFRRRGDTVHTIAASQKFFDEAYDYSLHDFLVEYFQPKSLVLSWIARFLKFGCLRGYERIDSQFRGSFCAKADLYIQVWTSGPRESEILQKLKASNAKIATFFMGSDVRHYPCFKQEFMPDDWDVPAKYDEPIDKKIYKLRRHERYSDAIFSVPDQMGLAVRPYFHLQIPLDYSKIRMNATCRERPLVIHAPTNRSIKGSDLIESALDSLKSDGVSFDYLPLADVPHDSLLRVLEVADVLVDELFLHGPGWLGFEAMAAGTVVATRFYEHSPESFRPPIFSINQENIKERLKVLFESVDLRRKLAIEGRAYVEKNNSISMIVQEIVDTVFNGRQPEYYPTFKYNPLSDKEKNTIDNATREFQ